MSLSFEGYILTDIINPNVSCTQVGFTNTEDPDIQKRWLVLFDKQIKYIEVEEHQKFKRVKVYVAEETEPIHLDFGENDDSNYDLFLRSIYNK